MSRRLLSDDEQALWTDVARSIKPLRPPKSGKPSTRSSPAEAKAKAPASVPRPQAKALAAVARHVPQQPAQTPPLAPLARRSRQRIARGREPIDARIDLHGMTQSQAHVALLHFLRRAQGDGAKTVLVVTGKGLGKGSKLRSGGDEGDALAERGVLRRQVPLWLALPEFRPLVVAFDDAHVGHGGQGALYVRLRREKQLSQR